MVFLCEGGQKRLEAVGCSVSVSPAMCLSIQLASSATMGFWPWLPCAAAMPHNATDSNDMRMLDGVQLMSCAGLVLRRRRGAPVDMWLLENG